MFWFVKQPLRDRARNIFSEAGVALGQLRMLVIKRAENNVHFARIEWQAPSAVELFYLRAILERRAADSYEDARTVNDVCHRTFQEAATMTDKISWFISG